jgi:hypothetical protein
VFLPFLALFTVNGGKPIFSESLAALAAMHLLLKRRRDRSSRDIASSSGVLQITENKSAAANLTKHKQVLFHIHPSLCDQQGFIFPSFLSVLGIYLQ